MLSIVVHRTSLAVALLVLVSVTLAGCGFHPVYAPSARSVSGVGGDLGQIQVALIPDRSGQLLRQALQQRLDRGDASPKRYELSVGYSIAAEQLGFQIDTSVTRQRLRATGTWTLRALDSGGVVATGTVRSLDGFDILNQQYFAADIANETALRRLAENVASQITLEVAAFIDRRSATG